MSISKSFLTYKKNRVKDLEKLKESVESFNGPKYENEEDPTFWYLKPSDKAGNGYAEIRFLPDANPEGIPYVRYWEYSFKGPGGWYIEKCRKSLGKEEADPVYEYRGELYDTKIESNIEKAKGMRRNLRFVSNIEVLKYPANPEDEGKVFKFRYGKKIFDKINDKMNPSSEFEEAMNPFDLFEGATFKLKRKIVSDYVNYDSSEFMTPAPLHNGDEEKLSEIFEKLYDLKEEILDEKHFKSYEKLKERLYKVMKLGEREDSTNEEIKEVLKEKRTEPKKIKEKESPKVKEKEKEDEESEDVDNVIESEDVDEFLKMFEED